MEKDVFKNTILEIYPSYVKKAIFKQAVKDGFVIDNKKHNGQLTLNLNNSVDVTDDKTLDDKFRHMFEQDHMLAVVEEYEYAKPYRHFCYFGYKNLCIAEIKDLVIDKEYELLEIRFDRIGIAYKNSNTFYKDKIQDILNFFRGKTGLQIENIDFKAVVEYMMSEEKDITFMAQRMTRKGMTAYLEAYEDEAGIIPILGELESFIAEQNDLFDKNADTRLLREKLKAFIMEIEVKSDIPMVKIRMEQSGIKFGITHNYKGTDYSLFMLYGELVGEELMSSVKEYLIQCYKKLNTAISINALPAEENK